MDEIRRQWEEAIGRPSYAIPKLPAELVERYTYDDFDLEVYVQRNDPKSLQRVMLALPKNMQKPCPAVVVPFYFPEGMLGFDPVTGESIERYQKITFLRDLAKRGYMAVSADAYYLTYVRNTLGISWWDWWTKCGTYLLKDHPNWSGMGKLVSDTSLLVDLLVADERADAKRIGILGHSLGGKMAFYTGCLDERIKVIVASDFGMLWENSNWEDIWYWHDKVEVFKTKNMDHAQLLGLAASKPFCLIAGEYDDMRSWEMMQRAPGYAKDDERLKIICHGTGHTPTAESLEEAYAFLDKWL